MHLFVFGTLMDPALRSIVMNDHESEPARLADHVVERAEGGDWPILVPQAGATAHGLLLHLDPTAAERASFYEAGFDYYPEQCAVHTEAGLVDVMLYRAPSGRGSGVKWDLATWQNEYGQFTRVAARDVMALFGTVEPEALRDLMPTLRVRADAFLRAQNTPVPRNVRSEMHRDQVEVLRHQQPYLNFYAVGETELRHPRFDGAMSSRMDRAAIHAADAVTVLPFDPARRRVLLVEQFRYGTWLRGDPYPWTLEPPAGRIDPGETAEQAARREVREEARIEIGNLHRIAGYYPIPTASTEFIDSFVGIADLPDGAGGLGGVEAEHEDIRTHILPLDAALDLVATGEAATGTLILSLFWLERALARGDRL